MSLSPPLVVAILESDGEDVAYQLYCAAYGIEMQIDNEWNAEVVLLAPYQHLNSVTEDTAVTGEDTVIVSAGVTDIPISDDGIADASVLKDPKNNWLLVGDPRGGESSDTINIKLQAALDAGCRVIICITDTTNDHIAERIRSLASIDCFRIVIAFVHPDATTPNVAATTAQSVRKQLAALGASGNPRFIVAGNFSGENAAKIVGSDEIDGVFLMEDNDFTTILEVVEALGK